MSVQTTPGALVDLGSAVLLLALAVFVATVKPRRRANLAFAAFAGTFGMGFLVGNLLTPDDPWWFASGWVSAGFLTLAAASLVALALLFPAPLPPPRARLLAPTAAVAAMAWAWAVFGGNALRNCLLIECRLLGLPLDGLFVHSAIVDGLLLAGFLFALLLLAIRYGQARDPGRARTRRQLALVSAALLLYPGLRIGFDLSAPAFVPFEVAPAMSDIALDAWGLLAILVLVAAVWLRNSRDAEGAERRAARNLALLHLAVPAAGLVLAFPLGRWPEAHNTGALGVARAASVLLLSYAILRYQLLGIDVQLKRTVRSGTVAGLFLGAYILVSVLSQTVVQGQAATWLGLAAAGLLVLAILPLQRLADRVADRALPGIRDGSTDLARQRLEVYRAALEQAGDDRTGTEGKVLAALRAKLGISEREAALLDAEVRAGVGRPAGAVEGSVVLGKYRVEAVLGQGGFGTTLLAYDERVHRRVVLKLAKVAGPDEAKRLLREARVLARLGHPHVLTCYDVEEVGGEVVLVLEYAEGGSLADRLRRGPLAVGEAVRIADDVLAALEAAHARDILHRDVKPGNILLTPEGRAKLADFGVARAPRGSGTVSGLTSEGNPGSVRYMSPEQVRGRPLDARSDLYSLGVVLHEALAGKPYLDFDGRGEFEARMAILEEDPALPLPGVPRALNQLLAACLAKDPALRPASAAEVRRLLAAAMRTAPRRKG